MEGGIRERKGRKREPKGSGKSEKVGHVIYDVNL